MSDIRIDVDPSRVANLLKTIINQNCTDGEEWYDDIGEMPSMFDMYRAIRILEDSEPATLRVIDDTIQTDCSWMRDE